jgi:hypothetical protein
MNKFSVGESASPATNLLAVIFREYLFRKAARIELTIGATKGRVSFDGKPMTEPPLPVCSAMFIALKVLIGHHPQFYAMEITGEFAYEHEGMEVVFKTTIVDTQQKIAIEKARRP